MTKPFSDAIEQELSIEELAKKIKALPEEDINYEIGQVLKNKSFKVKEFKEFLGLLEFDKVKNAEIIQQFIEDSNNKHNHFNIDELIEFIDSFEISHEGKLDIRSAFFRNQNNENNRLTCDQFRAFLNSSELHGEGQEERRRFAARLFLQNPNNSNNSLDYEGFVKFLDENRISDNRFGQIIQYFLINPNCKIDEEGLSKIFEKQNFSTRVKLNLISRFSFNAEPDIESSAKLLASIDFIDPDSATKFINKLIKYNVEKDTPTSVKELSQLIKAAKLEHDFDEVANLFFDLIGSQVNRDSISHIMEFATELYPNNNLLHGTLIESLLYNHSKELNEDQLKEIKGCIKELSDDAAIIVINSLKQNSIIEKESEFLLLLKGRINSMYDFASKVIDKKPLEEIFTESAIKNLHQLFGEKILSDEKITARDLLSYYDLEKIETFSQMLKEEVREQIKNSFSDNQNDLLISIEPHPFFKQLVPSKSELPII